MVAASASVRSRARISDQWLCAEEEKDSIILLRRRTETDYQLIFNRTGNYPLRRYKLMRFLRTHRFPVAEIYAFYFVNSIAKEAIMESKRMLMLSIAHTEELILLFLTILKVKI